MQHKPLQHALKSHFTLDPRRLEFIARFVIAPLKVPTVNLNQIATALNGHALLESNAKRAQRFLEFKLAQDVIARFVLSFVKAERLVLTIDHTTWKSGRVTINLLVIGVAYHGIALPIAWVNLDKDGNSNQAERMKLLERVLKLVPLEDRLRDKPAHSRIDCLGRQSQRLLHLVDLQSLEVVLHGVCSLEPRYHATRLEPILGFAADREFIGETWFASLLEHGVNPVIRVRKDTMIQHRMKKAPAWAWFNALKPGEMLELGKARVMGIRVFVIATLTEDGELLALVTAKRPSRALAIYAQRWEREQPVRCCLVSKKIETLLAALKSRGFNLEDTRVTSAERSERLFALLVVALVWVVLVGEFLTGLVPLRVRNHGCVGRSAFGRGLDCLRQILLSGRSGRFVLDDVVLLLSGS